MIKHIFLLIFLHVSFIAMAKPSAETKTLTWRNQPSKLNREQDTTFRIITCPGNTFGYEILIGNKPLIRQTSVPTKGGTAGFTYKSDAQKVAKLVIEKIRQGMMPPTIEKNELDKLKIRY